MTGQFERVKGTSRNLIIFYFFYFFWGGGGEGVWSVLATCFLMSPILKILSEFGSYSIKLVSDPLIFNHVFVVVPVPT